MGKRKDKNWKAGAGNEPKGVPARECGTKRFKDLNFKVRPPYHFYVTNLAAQRGISKVDLLRRAIALYVEKCGGPVLPEGSGYDEG